ncbi:MAG: serine hydrolase [Ginsengibacter sp.]
MKTGSPTIHLAIFLLLISCLDVSAQSEGDSLLNFIQQNKARSSVYLQENGLVTASLNENKLMPLATTVNIMVAIEFARQAAAEVFDVNQNISLGSVNRYYIPGTDEDAHPAWLKYEMEKGHFQNDSIKLIDVARGMMMFGSHANTEFIMDLLGYDNIQNNIPSLGLINHTAIYPMVSSLFMYQNPRKFKESKILKEIDDLTEEDYSKFILWIHNELKTDSAYKEKFNLKDFTPPMHKLWNERLPSSTTKEYVKVISILNKRGFFNTNIYGSLADILETLMESSDNRRLFRHGGMMGGSTLFVLTKALYITLMDGTRIEMAYFFNDLSAKENSSLQRWMSNFEFRVITDDKFRERIKF